MCSLYVFILLKCNVSKVKVSKAIPVTGGEGS
jgi:hypothetical protein